MYPQIFGKYVLERELAIGGMARVALATLRGAGGFEKKLVVKQIRDELSFDEEFIRRFVEEAKTTVALSHPNIVPVYELGVEQGTYFLAMEYVDGVSVDALLRNESGDKRGLSPEEGAYLGVEVCRALDYAHRRMQVVHRDITPRNVMVDEEGQVKLIDFGIAARASVAGHDVFGTPGHMPPEQLDRKELLPSTDIFALAVLLMEVWSGAPPFRRKTPTESLAQMHAPHPRPSEADIRLLPLDDALKGAMSLDPAVRPQQADDFGRALRRYLQDVDLGDVARKLGARVVEAKTLVAKKAARKKGQDALFKPSRPDIDMRPKTFAAREVVEKWATPASAPVEGTRRMPESGPSTPPMPETKASAASAEPPSSDRASAEPKIETVATRPIETPVKLTPEVTTPASRGRGLLIVGVGVALVAAAVAVAKLRGGADDPGTTASKGDPTAASVIEKVNPPPSLHPTANPTANPTASTHPIASSAPTAGPAPTANTNPPTNVNPFTNPNAALGPSSPSPTDSTTSRAASAQLVLVGDPGTQVSLDGAPYRPCPAVVSAKAGSHSVRFLFEPTHEERGQPVTLSPGARVTMRADFAAATPTIRVER